MNVADIAPAEHERIAALRRQVYADVPEAVEFIGALHAAGLVPGWRAVRYVGPPRRIPGAYTGPFLTGDEFQPRKDKK